MTDKLSAQPADLLASLLALVAKWHEQASRSSIGGDHMDAVEGQTLQLCADELQDAIDSLAAHRGEVSAWRVLNIGGDGEHGVWHDYKSGDLHLAGLIAEESEIEYAYKHPPQAQAVNDELGRRPIAWAVQSKAYGLCYSFSNEFIEAFPNAPVNYVVAQAGAGDAVKVRDRLWCEAIIGTQKWSAEFGALACDVAELLHYFNARRPDKEDPVYPSSAAALEAKS